MNAAKILFIIGLIISFNVNAISSDHELLLGQSGVFSGVSSELGTDLWKGANAYFTAINLAGGVNGKHIQVLTKEDNFEGKKSLLNTIDFVKNEHVFALFDYMGTQAIGESLPAIQKFSKDHYFLFSNFSGGQAQREKPHNGYVFNVRASYWQETMGLVEQFYKIGKRRYALFVQYDDYGRAGATGVRSFLKDRKLEVVAQTNYQRGASFNQTMHAQVKTIMAANPDVIMTVGSYAACAAFIRDARNAGYKGVIAGLSGVGADSLLNLLSIEGKKSGKDLTKNIITSQIVPPPTDTSYPLVKEYQDIMKKYAVSYPGDLHDNPKAFSFTSLEGYLNAKVFVEVAKTVKGEITREAFFKAAKELREFDIGLGKDSINFNNPASQGLNVVYYTTIDNGNYVIIKNWDKFR